MKYTDEDVQRLVEAAGGMEATLSTGGYTWPTSARHEQITAALKPFRPDPEEELLKDMANAYAKATGLADIDYVTPGMRAALSVVKEKGLPT